MLGDNVIFLYGIYNTLGSQQQSLLTQPQLPQVIQGCLLLTKDCVHAPGTAAAPLSWSLLLALHQLGCEGGHGAEGRGQGSVQTLRQLLLVGHQVCKGKERPGLQRENQRDQIWKRKIRETRSAQGNTERPGLQRETQRPGLQRETQKPGLQRETLRSALKRQEKDGEADAGKKNL